MIEAKQKEIIEDFSFYENWMQKYEHIIELAKELPTLEEDEKSDDLLISGCQSKVWLKVFLNADGTMSLKADSDAIITKGLVSLVVSIFNNEKPEDVVSAPIYFADEIGLSQNLSQTRSNGFAAMVKQIKLYATVFASQNKFENG
ncbi:MAG: SufE family protein [Bacteroidetes bacterium]|nr:SufE family protein [Bacteroidota bacterium]